MSQLLEILGRAITVDTADLIWNWFDAIKLYDSDSESAAYQQLDKIVEMSKRDNINTEAAEKQLRLYLFENPSCTRGRMASAAICLRNNHLQSAIEELNSVYLRQPTNTMALYALGHCYERLGKEAQAVEFYQDCLKFKNYLQLPRQRLAAIYFKNSQLEKTIQEYELLKAEYPDDIPTLVSLGHLYMAVGEFGKAVETFNTAILIHPDNFSTNCDDVDQLILDGQLEEAMEQLDQLMETQSDKADLHMKRADILSMMGATAEAVSQYEEAIRICPDFLEATIKLGTQYLQMHSEQAAAYLFNKASEINNQIVDAYMGLAIAQKLAGSTSEAMGILSLASAIEANTPLLFAEVAALQLKAGLRSASPHYEDDHLSSPIEEVIRAHQEQIALRPQNPDLHYRLGILMMSVGRLTDATIAFQAALEINPTYSRARTKMTICLFDTDQKDKAMQELAAFSEPLDKDTLALHYKTSLLYCDKVRFASSLMDLDQHMQNNFACTDAPVNISIVLQNLGLLDRATAIWENLADTTHTAMRNNQF